MNTEIISVSSDLLAGKTVNKDTAFLTRELASLGIPANRTVQVKDQEAILKTAIQQAEETVDFIILVGGLGPDENDITKQTLSKYLDVPLVLDRNTEDRMITYHKNSEFTMPDQNQLQAMVIQDSTPIQNVTGLAAGMFFQKGGKTYLLLPGPNDELVPTFTENAKPLIMDKLLNQAIVVQKTLKLFGLREAEVSLELKDLLNYESTPFVGIYQDGEEIEILISVKESTKNKAEEEADKIKDQVKNRLGQYIFAEEKEGLPEIMKQLLTDQGLTVTAAESLTGGAFLSMLSSRMEASKVFSGGIVSYSERIKNDVLGVSKEITGKFGVVSPQCAIEMAEKSRDMFEADIGVSLTGVAGPSSLEGKIPGTVWIGIAQAGKESYAKQYHFAYKRNKNRRLAVLSAMNLVRKLVLNQAVEGSVVMDEEVHGEESSEEFQ